MNTDISIRWLHGLTHPDGYVRLTGNHLIQRGFICVNLRHLRIIGLLAHRIAARRFPAFDAALDEAGLDAFGLQCIHHGVTDRAAAHPRFEIALERALTELLQGRALDALGGFPEPGFDLEEITSPPNLEIHFVDSSGIISWNFLGDSPDFEFNDWNFSSTTEEDYAWLVERIHAEGGDIYIADYTHLGVYACRIIVPGMSEIYPVDDLEWENNSVGNAIRPAILQLADLDDDECADLLGTLNELGLDDQRPVAALIGLHAPGMALEGCDMHRRLLEAYGKLRAVHHES